jgi:hypothetical protein
VEKSGNLRWYKDLAQDGTTNFAPNSGAVVGTGWDNFNRVIDGGNGILYTIDAAGNLRWYKDTHRDGTPATASGAPSFDAPNNGAVIGSGWESFTQVFSGGDGVLYTVDALGNLHWYKDTHRDGTPVTATGAPSFDAPNNTAIIGLGWNIYTTVISTGNGVIFGRDTAGDLWWYKDLARNGTDNWDSRSGTKIGSGFDPGSFPHLFSGGVNAAGDTVIYAVDSRNELRFYSVREHVGSAPTFHNNGVGSPIGPGWPEPQGPAKKSHPRRQRASVPAPPGAAKDFPVGGTSGPVGDGKRSH